MQSKTLIERNKKRKKIEEKKESIKAFCPTNQTGWCQLLRFLMNLCVEIPSTAQQDSKLLENVSCFCLKRKAQSPVQ